MRILITGATGQLGPYIAKRLLQEGALLTLWSHRSTEPVFGAAPRRVALAATATISAAYREAAPDAVIHCAAVSNINEAFTHPDKARAVNVAATAALADLARSTNAKLIYFSTDLVFDGEKGGYTESDTPRPLSVYGQTKLDGEAPVLASGGTVLRLPLVIGPSLNGQVKFFDQLLAALRQKKALTLFDDEWRTPVSPLVVAEAVVLLLRSDITGLFHLPGPERLSRYDIGVRLAQFLGTDVTLLKPASRLSIQSAEPRPRDTSLDGGKWHRLFPGLPRPAFEESMRDLLQA